MKKLALIVTIIILGLSLYGGYEVLFFLVNNHYNIFNYLKLSLCILGIASFILYLLKKETTYWLNFIWFLPQIFTIVHRRFDVFQKIFYDTPIYDLTIGFNFGFILMWQENSYTYFSLQINIVAIIGLLLSICIPKKVYREHLI